MADDERIDENESGRLAPLGPRLQRAFTLRQQGQTEEATRILREILTVEPRLAEPRLELAAIAAEVEDWDEAEQQARQAVVALRAGGQWTADVSGSELLAFALNLLGEVIIRPLQDSDGFLQDRARYEARWNEAATLFEAAVAADPTLDDARRNRSRYRRLTTAH